MFSPSAKQWRSQGGGGGGGARGPCPPPKLLVVNFPINLRCYVLLGCRVINVIMAINIGDSAFFDIAAHLVKDVVPSVFDFTGYRHGETDRTTTHNPRRTERRQQTRESRRSIPVSPQNCPA